MPPSADQLPGVPRKSIENPARTKPVIGSDAENALALEQTLERIPSQLATHAGDRFPLLRALRRHESADHAGDGSTPSRDLLLIAALIHDDADERRTAEYLLRHRNEVTNGERSSLSLLVAARCAAEMDIRRLRLQEMPSEAVETAAATDDAPRARVADPSVAEVVARFLCRVTGVRVTGPAYDRLADGVTIALELAERHRLNNGKGPSLIAMRPDARRDARLVTHLRTAFDDAGAARSLARLLIGSDGTPIETALLWWTAHAPRSIADIPAEIRQRWVRDALSITQQGSAIGDRATTAASVCR